jgi:hypothetical protein
MSTIKLIGIRHESPGLTSVSRRGCTATPAGMGSSSPAGKDLATNVWRVLDTAGLDGQRGTLGLSAYLYAVRIRSPHYGGWHRPWA